MKIHQHQQGFSVVEALLIFVIVGLVGFVGWFVWHSKQVAEKASDQASSVESAPSSAKASSSQKFISILEWGVEAPYNGPLQLSYKITDTEAVFSSKALTDLYAGCEGFAGTIRRYDMTELKQLGQDGPFGTPGVTTKIVGKYGYVFVHAQSECAGSLPNDAAFTANEAHIHTELANANNAVKLLVTNLKVDSCATEPELSAPCAKKNGVY
jgi:hypothetical protein